MKSLRLKNYDYSTTGYYFITICSLYRENLFSDIIEQDFNNGPRVELSEIGKIIENVWLSISEHHSAETDYFVVMPNHIHGIVAIINDGRCRVNARIHPTTGRFFKPPSGSLPTVVGSFKSECTKQIRCLDNFYDYRWQPNYYEHIVRNEKELHKIRNYIIDNPRKWYEDIENQENKLTKAQINKHYDELFYY